MERRVIERPVTYRWGPNQPQFPTFYLSRQEIKKSERRGRREQSFIIGLSPRDGHYVVIINCTILIPHRAAPFCLARSRSTLLILINVRRSDWYLFPCSNKCLAISPVQATVDCRASSPRRPLFLSARKRENKISNVTFTVASARPGLRRLGNQYLIGIAVELLWWDWMWATWMATFHPGLLHCVDCGESRWGWSKSGVYFGFSCWFMLEWIKLGGEFCWLSVTLIERKKGSWKSCKVADPRRKARENFRSTTCGSLIKSS